MLPLLIDLYYFLLSIIDPTYCSFIMNNPLVDIDLDVNLVNNIYPDVNNLISSIIYIQTSIISSIIYIKTSIISSIIYIKTSIISSIIYIKTSIIPSIIYIQTKWKSEQWIYCDCRKFDELYKHELKKIY